VITFVGQDPDNINNIIVAPGSHEFYFRFCDGSTAGKYSHGWWCWNDRCWRTE
jgi:hypothetical protein